MSRSTVTVADNDDGTETVTITGPEVIQAMYHLANQAEGVLEHLIGGPASAFLRMGYSEAAVDAWMEKHYRNRNDDLDDLELVHHLMVAQEIVRAIDATVPMTEDDEES